MLMEVASSQEDLGETPAPPHLQDPVPLFLLPTHWGQPGLGGAFWGQTATFVARQQIGGWKLLPEN